MDKFDEIIISNEFAVHSVGYTVYIAVHGRLFHPIWFAGLPRWRQSMPYTNPVIDIDSFPLPGGRGRPLRVDFDLILPEPSGRADDYNLAAVASS